MGNICRSPTAEGCMKSHIIKNNQQTLFEVDSAGTIGYHSGEAPDLRSQDEALKNKIDLSQQKARQVLATDFSKFDYIVAMDKENLLNLMKIKPEHTIAKLSLLTDWLDDTTFVDVPDPYYGGGNGFTTVFNLVEAATGSMLQQLISENY